MSDTLQHRARLSRAERTTTSCSECRRRKQKCSQGQPCTNCARRFPQPVCEYKPSKRANPPGVSTLPTFTVTLKSSADKEPGTKESLLEAPRPRWLRERAQGRPSRGGGYTGEVGRWSGVDVTTHYPSSIANIEDMHNWHGDGFTWGYISGDKSGDKSASDLTLCDKDCKEHPQVVHDAVRLILFRFSIPDKFLVRWDINHLNEIIAYSNETLIPSVPPIAWPDSMADFRHLPMTPTKVNADLLRIFLKLLCRYKACLDGNPDGGNPIIKFYFPFCIQEPLLLQIVLYTSACFLNETGHMPKMAVMAQKGKAIHMLNEHLRSQPLQTSDAAIAGVVQLIVDEWYWGDTGDLKAHLRGLRDMIRLRGGLRSLGMHGLLAKLVISHDLGIALAHEIKPFLRNGPEFEFEDPNQVPFRLPHNTPLVASLAPFSSCAEPLGLHPATASILDDVRFLINTVMSLSPDPSPQELQKVKSTAKWMLERIQNLDAESPEPQTPTDANSPASVDAASPSGAGSSSRKGSTASLKNVKPGSTHGSSRRHSTATASSRSSASPPAELGPRPDYMYRVVRMAALVTLRAIANRQPLSQSCPAAEFLQVWTISWRVPLTVWRATIGVFNWVMFTIIPACHGGPHERFVRTMWMISMVSRGVDNWHVMVEAARVGMRLQRWLAGKEWEENAGPEAGGGVVAKFGYQGPEW